ncbi:MAG: DUF480 domain-containing protein, partial [Solirubrobacteraceae bacterium]
RELVVRLARRPGQMEDRYAQRMGGEAEEEVMPPAPVAAPAAAEDLLHRVERLERQVAELRARLG